MFKIIKNRKIYFIISGILVGLSILALIFFGLKPSIDFTGGTLMEVEFEKGRPDVNIVREKLGGLDLGVASVQPSGDEAVIVKAKDLTNEQRNKVLKNLKKDFGKVNELRFESIGPSIGKELKDKAYVSIIVVVICIVLYIAYVFRKMSSTIASWKMGMCAIVALAHDVIITCGVFAILGRFMGVEVDTLFVTALLMVLGYSINDTIVVFDRVRYNVLKNSAVNFEVNVERSVNQTMVRSLSTSITTFLVLLALYLFGGETIKWFVFALMIGVIVGTYSSIFLASPLLVEWERRGKR